MLLIGVADNTNRKTALHLRISSQITFENHYVFSFENNSLEVAHNDGDGVVSDNDDNDNYVDGDNINRTFSKIVRLKSLDNLHQ